MNASAAKAAARLLAVCALAWSLPVAAGPGAPMERLALTLDEEGIVGQESATVARPDAWGAATRLSTAQEPLTLRTREGAPAGALVSARTTLAVLVTRSFGDRLALGLALPVVLHQATGTIGSISGASDFWLGGKFRIAGGGELPWALAATLALTVPGSDAGLIADTGTTLRPGVVAGFQRNGWRTGLQLEAHLRPTRELLGLPISSELLASAGVARRLFDDGVPPLELALTVLISTGLSEPFQRQTGAEVRGEISGNLPGGLKLGLGGGAGFGGGVGTPASRLFLSMRWSAP